MFFLNVMRYINLRFAYVLTYLLTAPVCRLSKAHVHSIPTCQNIQLFSPYMTVAHK